MRLLARENCSQILNPRVNASREHRRIGSDVHVKLREIHHSRSRPTTSSNKQIVAEVERRLSVIEELEATVEANLTRADRLRQST